VWHLKQGRSVGDEQEWRDVTITAQQTALAKNPGGFLSSGRFIS
jgi:hypothetical protein